MTSPCCRAVTRLSVLSLVKGLLAPPVTVVEAELTLSRDDDVRMMWRGKSLVPRAKPAAVDGTLMLGMVLILRTCSGEPVLPRGTGMRWTD